MSCPLVKKYCISTKLRCNSTGDTRAREQTRAQGLFDLKPQFIAEEVACMRELAGSAVGIDRNVFPVPRYIQAPTVTPHFYSLRPVLLSNQTKKMKSNSADSKHDYIFIFCSI
jgi:hypothetical protein